MALRALLAERRFEEFTAALTEAQDEFNRDNTLEYWILDAADSVGTSERALLPLLDAWCKATPGSFAPWLARGTHRVGRGWLARGTKWLKDTPRSAIEAMVREASLAQADLTRAQAQARLHRRGADAHRRPAAARHGPDAVDRDRVQAVPRLLPGAGDHHELAAPAMGRELRADGALRSRV